VRRWFETASGSGTLECRRMRADKASPHHRK
jgi:hypothetical protein